MSSDVDRLPRLRNTAMTMASPTAASAAATAMTKKREDVPGIRSPRCRGEGEEGQVGGVEHQLDAHEARRARCGARARRRRPRRRARTAGPGSAGSMSDARGKEGLRQTSGLGDHDAHRRWPTSEEQRRPPRSGSEATACRAMRADRLARCRSSGERHGGVVPGRTRRVAVASTPPPDSTRPRSDRRRPRRGTVIGRRRQRRVAGGQEHDHEEEEHHDRAGVDQDLQDREEVREQQHVDAGQAEEGPPPATSPR